MKCSRIKFKAFSLLEMVVASTILSMAVVTITSLSIKSMTATRLNQERETAWELIDRQLTMIEYIGIDSFMESDQMSGQFGDEMTPGPVYTWQAMVTDEDYDWLYNVMIQMSWGPENRQHQLTAATLLMGTPSSYLEEEQATDTGSVQGE